MSVIGAGLSPFGTSFAGFGLTVNQTPVKNAFWVESNNTQGNSRYINPNTGDYVMNTGGFIAGMSGTQQMVYLALLTIKGSAADASVGQAFFNIQVVSGNYQQQIVNQVNNALSSMVTNNLIKINSINVVNGPATRIIVSINWTDLQTSQIFTNNI